ncbi:MAG TPA: YmdB family metallophosphoesterase, partial [Firmicutes bacterium]|nr:YmdB family metallophosphoesterase [Bacillota bacterium]
CGLIVDVDANSGKAKAIERVRLEWEDHELPW